MRSLIGIVMLVVVIGVMLSLYLVLFGRNNSVRSVNHMAIAISPKVPIVPLSVPSGVNVYVVGSSQFVNRLVSAGIPYSIIRSVSLEQLSYVPGNSIVFLDWDYVNKTLRVGLSELARYLEMPVGRGDLIIVYVNSSSPYVKTMIEYAIAVAWGNYYHSKVIGFPVMNVTGPGYVVSYGGKGLIMNIVPVSEYYTNELTSWIAMWHSLSLGYAGGSDPLTNVDPCMYIEQTYGGELNGEDGWFFGTGQNYLPDSFDDTYIYDYCVIVGPTVYNNEIGVEQYGYMYYSPAMTASINEYSAAINTGMAYLIDDEYGYNSFIGVSSSNGAQPTSTSCSLGILELMISIAKQLIEILYEIMGVGGGDQPVYVASLSVFGTAPIQSYTWSFGVDNSLFCTAQPLQPYVGYPVGFGVTNWAETWFLNAGSNNVNTAAVPVFEEQGTMCLDYTWQESFGGIVTFILQYNPGATWSVQNLAIAYVGNEPYNYISGSCS